jgi:hypothetical protein
VEKESLKQGMCHNPSSTEPFMKQSGKLTKKQKRAGKRKLLIPSKEIQELMQPITLGDFEGAVRKAIPPSPPPDPAEKQTSAH